MLCGKMQRASFKQLFAADERQGVENHFYIIVINFQIFLRHGWTFL